MLQSPDELRSASASSRRCWDTSATQMIENTQKAGHIMSASTTAGQKSNKLEVPREGKSGPAAWRNEQWQPAQLVQNGINSAKLHGHNDLACKSGRLSLAIQQQRSEQNAVEPQSLGRSMLIPPRVIQPASVCQAATFMRLSSQSDGLVANTLPKPRALSCAGSRRTTGRPKTA